MVKCAHIVVVYALTVCFYHSGFVCVYYGGTLINVGLEGVFHWFFHVHESTKSKCLAYVVVGHGYIVVVCALRVCWPIVVLFVFIGGGTLINVCPKSVFH